MTCPQSCLNSYVTGGHAGKLDHCPDCDSCICLMCNEEMYGDTFAFYHYMTPSVTNWCPNYIARSQLSRSGTPVPVTGSPSLTAYDTELTPPMGTPIPVAQCECGSRALGVKDWAPGHSSWCGVYGDGI